jgi:hypothetical protein
VTRRRRYVEKVLSNEIARVRTAADGNRNCALFRSSSDLGGFVGAGALSEQSAQEELEAAAVDAGVSLRVARGASAPRRGTRPFRRWPSPRSSGGRLRNPDGPRPAPVVRGCPLNAAEAVISGAPSLAELHARRCKLQEALLRLDGSVTLEREVREVQEAINGLEYEDAVAAEEGGRSNPLLAFITGYRRKHLRDPGGK